MRTAAYPGVLNGVAVLPWRGTKAWAFHLGLVAAAVLLPAVAHLTGAPVRWLLPMHWPIILAGLVYGWRSGLMVGLLAPGTNYLLTGIPLPLILPAMTLELAVYGFVTGWLRERLNLSGFAAVGVALIAGRIVFLSVVLLTGAALGSFGKYVIAAMLPGLAAGVVQVVLMPVVAKVWMNKSN